MGQTTSTKKDEKALNVPWGPQLPGGSGKRTCLITGGNSGLGFETARSLLVKGYKVIIACRNPDKATEAVAKLRSLASLDDTDESISYEVLDVSSLNSVDKFADKFLSNSNNQCHVLICNAGIMMGAQRQSADGFDLQLATNYLGHVYLIKRMQERLVECAPGRIIHVSSIAARFGHIYWNDINFFGGDKYDSLKMYQQSKLLQVVFSRELAKRLKGTGITSNSLEPGIVKTGLSATITDDPAMRRRLENGISVEEGSKTHVHLASCTDASVVGITGEHWEKCGIISQGFSKLKYILAAHDLRESVGPKLWDFTEKLIKDARKKS